MKTSACLLFSGVLAITPLHAQGPAADPFVRAAPGQPAEEDNTLAWVSICYETFSLDIGEAAELYHKKMGDTKMYAEIKARVAKGQAKLETFTVIRARSGEKALVESISELIYPTEFEHGNGPTPSDPSPTRANIKEGTNPTIPPQVATNHFAPAAPAGYFAPILPTSFETRNTGVTLEVEPTISRNNQIIDLRFAPDNVTFVERSKWGQGVSEAELPVFESQRITTAVTLYDGQPQLVGTPNQPPVSKVNADSAKRVWFAFVTADVVRVVKDK